MRSLPRAIAVASLSVLACHGSSTATSSDPSPAGSSTTSGAAVAPAGDGASCALVSKSEAEAIVGEPLQEPTTAYNGMCEYRRAADLGKKASLPILTLKVYPGLTKATFESEAKNAASLGRNPIRPIAGLGEDAFEVGSFQIMALQRGKGISATHLEPLEQAKLEAFVRKALGKL